MRGLPERLPERDRLQTASDPGERATDDAPRTLGGFETDSSRLLELTDGSLAFIARRFDRLLLFGWWSGNGDMHLKNFSLLTGEDGLVRLTPAYDLVSTHLVIPDDPLALPVGGKKTNLVRGDWLRFAAYCGLPPAVAERVLQRQVHATEDAVKLIGRSCLPADQRSAYEVLARGRSRLIA